MIQSLKDAEWWEVALMVGGFIILFFVIAGASTMTIFYRDRDAGCFAAGGQTMTIGSRVGCYHVNLEPLTIEDFRE